MFFDHRAAVSVIFSALTTLAAPLAADASVDPCDTPRFLAADDDVRHVGGHGAETHCYRLDLPSAGLLSLGVTSSSARPSPATLSVRDATASRGTARRVQTLGRNATEVLVLAAAGTYLVEIRAEDPRRPWPDYRLASRFVDLDADRSETNGEPEIEPELSETNGEPEIEPELFVARRILRADGSETNGEPEIEPELMLGRITRDAERLDAWLARLCHTATTDEGDDHADFLACATPIAQPIAAELDNGWGDDIDTFRFEVTHWQTVEITSEGLDTVGALYDRHGQRLTVAGSDHDHQGEVDGFRMVRTLAPGGYFVQVAGTESGPYTLRVETLAR